MEFIRYRKFIGKCPITKSKIYVVGNNVDGDVGIICIPGCPRYKQCKIIDELW